jgi:hypothetical protein
VGRWHKNFSLVGPILPRFTTTFESLNRKIFRGRGATSPTLRTESPSLCPEALPAAKYDRLFSPRESAEQWEKDNHSCRKHKGDLKKSCEAWWGHCNAWAAAGIKELEPRKAIHYQGTQLTVADQKAWITELWMNSSSLFSGRTNKSVKTDSWVLDANSTLARTRLSYGLGTNFDAFWDVSPRTFFLIFTNYVGVMQQGVVIDRFTGDEVWNQPISGYRILPIRKTDILPSVTNEAGYTVYPVKIRMKIYWANDGVPEEHVSDSFDIMRTKDDERIENLGSDYAGRLLAFKLFFDRPLEMEGTTVLSAGRIVGDGIWDHQENPPRNAKNLDHTHPDFIWMPLELDQMYYSNSNPNMTNANVRAALEGAGSASAGSEPEMANEIQLSFRSNVFGEDGVNEALVRARIRRVLEREGIRHRIYNRDIQIDSSTVRVTLRSAAGLSRSRVARLLAEAGLDTI